MLYDFVIWAGPAGVLSSRQVGVMLHRSVWHGRSRSAAHRAAPAPPAVHQRRVTTLPAACRTGAAPAGPRTRPPVLARRARERAGVRGGCLARDETRTSAGSWRLLVYPGHALPRRARSRRHDHGAGTARTGARRERDGGALPSLSIYLYTLSRSRRSNMQPARDHLNSITVVCASPRRAAPLRLHRPHVARVYRTTGDHRTHYLIKSRSEPKRPPRG